MNSTPDVVGVTLPNAEHLVSEFGYPLGVSALLFSEENNMTINASQIVDGAYVWAGGEGSRLVGGQGNDVLVSTQGAGGDVKTGGAGADIFVWKPLAPLTAGARSTVTDFNRDQGDRLDLSYLFSELNVGDEINRFFQINIDGDDAILSFDIDLSGTFSSVYSILLQNAHANQSITLEDNLRSLYVNQAILV
jgi:Ca2+-binding RTX toxin-like protein